MEHFSEKTVELFAGVGTASKLLEKSMAEKIALNDRLEKSVTAFDIVCKIDRFGVDFNKIFESSAYMKIQSAFEKINWERTVELSSLTGSLTSSFAGISNSCVDILGRSYHIFHEGLEDIPEEDQAEEVKVSEKIISEILLPESKKIITPESPIITVAPINDEVLRYLKENPEEWFNLDGTQFQMVMQEIYSRLGYKVEATKLTRDGGKDLIIRKHELIGDFVYYVECKKFAPDRPIGVGIVKEFKCTVDTDKVNGGIIATTSRFTRDAKKFILDNEYNYQVQMHDGFTIKNFLNQVC